MDYGISVIWAGTAIFIILRNYEMKDKIYCFIIFTIAIYGRSYILIGRNIDIIESLSSRTKYLVIINIV
jgi:hypothetical protein